MRVARQLLLTLTALLALAAPAQANHHFLRITEVFAGTAAQPDAEFVELQASQSGQNIVSTKRLRVYDAAGNLVTTATFTANAAVQGAQMTVLIGTSQAASYFGVTPDLLMTAGIPPAGGRICWENTTVNPFVDCVAWGSYAGPDSGKGEANPVNPSGGIPAGMALLRDLSRGSNATTLQVANNVNPDPGDDVDSSATDFSVVPTAKPRNNAGGLMTKGSALGAPAGALTFDSDAAAVNNRVNVTAIPGGDYRVTDTIAPIVASDGCAPERVDAAVCSDPVSGQLSGGPGNDTMTTSGMLPVTLQGEDGNDTMRSGAGADTLVGALGNDKLTGGAGVDDLDGDEGADTLDGGIGADTLDGGTGIDTATWAARNEPVVVDIDAEADDGNDDDGLPGARDTTSTTIENLTGGLAVDTLTGSSAANVFDGGFGGDVIDGLGGLNTITYAKRTGSVFVDLDAGTGGDAVLDDASGDSLANIRNIVGGSGGDTLTGDELSNKITGGKGTDTVAAGEGADQVLIRDAGVIDDADCGGGTDRFQADAGDDVIDCETPF